jgi:hypothetical protein
MKTRTLLIAVSLVLLVGAGFIMLYRSRGQVVMPVRVTGPLTTNDVTEITQLVLRERAPVLPGHFASPKDRVALQRRLRERVAADIRSIASVDGQTAVVDFGDRWDARIGYDYDLERTTNGWKVIGVGWRGPSGK